MRLDERIDTALQCAQGDDNGIDRHYPERLLKVLQAHMIAKGVDGGLVGAFDRGDLSAAMMRDLESAWRNMQSDIDFVLKVCSVKAKRDRVQHSADGTEAAVLAYVKSHLVMKVGASSFPS